MNSMENWDDWQGDWSGWNEPQQEDPAPLCAIDDATNDEALGTTVNERIEALEDAIERGIMRRRHETTWGKNCRSSCCNREPADAGTLEKIEVEELCPLDSEWVKCNLDSGAATTAFPKEAVKSDGAKTGSAYRTASGEIIEGYGAGELVGRDENGKMRKLSGEVTDVHKVLVSASAVNSNRQMTILQKGGGWIIPENSPIGKELLGCLNRVLSKYGTSGLLPIYEEKGIYNFYIKKEQSKDQKSFATRNNNHQQNSNSMDLSAASKKEDGTAPSQGGSSGSANSRHATRR